MFSYIITFIIIYILTLTSYIFFKLKGNFKKRAINKIILSALFVLLALIGFFLNYSLLNIEFIKILAIISAFVGDILFLFSFKKGGISFLLANIFLILYLSYSLWINHACMLNVVISLSIFIIMYIFYIYISKKFNFNMGNNRNAIYIYLLFVTLSASLATSLFITNPFNYYLTSIGIILFMLSDYVLMTYKFKYNNKYLIILNSITYFIGYLLISISLI